jgi:hypothetical protein
VFVVRTADTYEGQLLVKYIIRVIKEGELGEACAINGGER